MQRSQVESRVYMRTHFRGKVRRVAEIQHVENCDILQPFTLAVHSLRETDRRSSSMTEYNFRSRFKRVHDSLVCRANTLTVKFLPLHSNILTDDFY